ncbi:MAG: MoaD/ThiS family protein [Candidatus Methanoplasma sp.]|jgi:sulfur carrier protein|nr:MoaD/ThiS family protein [Candidatus Methanoplasma sp.]
MGAKISIGSNEYEIVCGPTIGDAVRSLDYVPDAFVFMINERVVPMDTPVSDGAVIKAVRVASGG